MNDDDADLGALALDLGDGFNGEPVAYGQPPAPPYRAEQMFDGLTGPAPRRVEALDTSEQTAWLGDVTEWTSWLIVTFRLTRWFPPCWRAHPALVEEAQALFLGWNAAWLPGTDPAGPLMWLRELDAALHRIETRWQISCSPDQHKTPSPVPDHAVDHPVSLRRWWSNDDFDGIHW